MLAEEDIDGFLLLAVVNEVLIESHTTLEAVVQHAFDISFACSGDVGVSRSCARVVFGQHVPVVSPGVLEVNHEHGTVIDAVCCDQDGWGVDNLLHVDTHLLQHGSQHMIGHFRLNQVGSVQIVEAVDPDHSVLGRHHDLFLNIFLVISKILGHSLQLLSDQKVASLKLLSLRCAVHVKVLILHLLVSVLFH